MEKYDVIVIGVGAVGSAVCYHLIKRGVRVLGIEKFDIPHAQGSSHGFSRQTKISVYVGGHFEPLIYRSFELWRLLEYESDQALLLMTGFLNMSPDENWNHLKGKISHEVLSHGQLKEKFPQFILPQNYTGCWEPNGGLLRPELAISSHVLQALWHGAEIHAREAVTNWEETSSSVIVRTTQRTYVADQVVFTSGAWTGEIVQGLGVNLTVTRLALNWVWPKVPELFNFGKCPIWQINTAEGAYYGFPMMPDNPGFKLALHSHGDPTHPDRIDRIPNKDDEQSSRAALDKFIPEANGPLLSQKICMYTHTPDKLPIVDRHPKFSRVILGGAFSGEGFKFSSVYGEIIADLVVKGKPEMPIEFMSFNRFAN